MSYNGALLKSCLSAAVPLWILSFKDKTFSELQAIADACTPILTEHGDNILFRSEEKGGSALAFNALAKSIACLSFAPGGVDTFGMHFEAKAWIDTVAKRQVSQMLEEEDPEEEEEL